MEQRVLGTQGRDETAIR